MSGRRWATAALSASRGIAKAKAGAKAEASASGPAGAAAVQGVHRPACRLKSQEGFTWLLTLNGEFASQAMELAACCDEFVRGSRCSPAVEAVELTPNEQIKLVWKWWTGYKSVAKWLKPRLDECEIPVRGTSLKTSDPASGRIASQGPLSAASGAHRPAVRRRPSAKTKASSSPLEPPAPAAASSGVDRPAAAEPDKGPRQRRGRRKRGQLFAAGSRPFVAQSAKKLRRRLRCKQAEWGGEMMRPMAGEKDPQCPQTPYLGGPSDAQVPEPHEPWFFQRALALRRLCIHGSPPPPKKGVHRPWEKGSVLHRYESCIIWKYEHREHGPVIAKVMTHGGIWDMDMLFLREVDMLSRLRGHPNLIRMVDIFATHEQAVIVTRYGGIDLHELLHRPTVPLPQPYPGWIALLEQLLCGLSYMHYKDLVHADIKPGNCVVDDTQSLRIIDVGRSWVDRPGVRPALGVDYVAKLGSLELMTYCYRSPEVFLCDPNFGRPMDMWGVGCIALELWIMKPLICFLSESSLDIVTDIFRQLSLQAKDAVAYFCRLPAWTDSMGKVPYPSKDALEPRLHAAQVPASVRNYICQGLLLVHPRHRLKVAPAILQLSSTKAQLERHS